MVHLQAALSWGFKFLNRMTAIVARYLPYLQSVSSACPRLMRLQYWADGRQWTPFHWRVIGSVAKHVGKSQDGVTSCRLLQKPPRPQIIAKNHIVGANGSQFLWRCLSAQTPVTLFVPRVPTNHDFGRWGFVWFWCSKTNGRFGWALSRIKIGNAFVPQLRLLHQGWALARCHVWKCFVSQHWFGTDGQKSGWWFRQVTTDQHIANIKNHIA